MNVTQVRRWCEEDGISVGPDHTVSRKDAAALVNRSPLTLRNWALQGREEIPFTKHNGRYRTVCGKLQSGYADKTTCIIKITS